MSRIRFRDSCHWYTKEGKAQHDASLREARKEFLYPSVTSIDKATFPNPFLEKWKIEQMGIAAAENPRQPHESSLQYAQRVYELSCEKAFVAAEFGKKVHKGLELWPAAPEASILPWWIHFDKWMQDHQAVFISNEVKVLHHGIGVAGQMDLKCTLAGIRSIVDYKTQDVKIDDKGRKKPAFYDSWVRQLAFYEQADRIEHGHVDPSQCVSLIIDSNDGGLIYEKFWTKEEIQAAYEEFVAGSWLFFRERNYWPTGKPWSMERVIP